ncbi:50S ribosomal protein L27 [Venturia canescens]|uniref:50S ribosomal protein L27 n=1 Tax=Venturia canescens TaxID=32260 RepID=UPI001C9C3B93|nr:50S ribosomal protein L27 [Venturia canescens]
MALLNNLLLFSLKYARQAVLVRSETPSLASVRHASKKSGTSTRIKPGHPRPKHRGWKVQDGHMVQPGRILVTQRVTRFHPGLHVGFGKNGTLWALEKGKVAITCEKVDLNWDHTWIQRCYGGRQNQLIYKKYFNVIPEKHHTTFKLVDLI